MRPGNQPDHATGRVEHQPCGGGQLIGLLVLGDTPSPPGTGYHHGTGLCGEGDPGNGVYNAKKITDVRDLTGLVVDLPP